MTLLRIKKYLNVMLPAKMVFVSTEKKASAGLKLTWIDMVYFLAGN